jgi:hypothetical protein
MDIKKLRKSLRKAMLAESRRGRPSIISKEEWAAAGAHVRRMKDPKNWDFKKAKEEAQKQQWYQDILAAAVKKGRLSMKSERELEAALNEWQASLGINIKFLLGQLVMEIEDAA